MKLAEFLRDSRDSLLAGWAKAARRLAPLPGLDRPVLRPHGAALCELLISAIDRPEQATAGDGSSGAEFAHRISSPVERGELSAEVAVLREVVHDALWSSGLPLAGPALTRLNRVLDDVIVANQESSRLARDRLVDEQRQSEELMQAVLDSATAVIFVKDVEGRYIKVNRRYEQAFQVRREEMIGRSSYDPHPAEIAAMLRANDQQVVSTGKPIEVEETIDQDDGLHTYIVLKFPLHDARGRTVGLGGIATDITELKRADEEKAAMLAREKAARAEAEEARALLDTFLNSSPVGFAFFDHELRYVRVNPALAALHNAPLESFLGRRLRDVLPRVAEHMEPLLRRVLETGEPVRGTGIRLELPPGSGHFSHRLGNFSPVRGAHGEMLGVGAAITDISERVELLEQVQTARAEAERSLAIVDAVFDCAPIALAFVDPELRYIRVNPAMALMNGRSAEEHVGLSMSQVVPAAEPLARRVLETGESIVAVELALAPPTAPDRVGHYIGSLYPVRLPDGRILGVGGAIMDITARKQAESELERALALLRAVLDQMPSGVLIAEASSGRLLLGNKQAERLCGLKHTPVRFAQIADYERDRMMHADGSPYRAAEYPLARSLLHAEVIVREESLYRRADGVVRRFLSSSAPVLDGQGRVVAGVTVFYDITEQREAEARTAVLTEATATLSASLDYDTTLARVAELAVPEFSDWCLVHMKEDDGSARAVAVAHRDPAKARTARDLLMRSHLNPDASGATAQVIRTGKPFLTDNISEAELATTARTPEHLAFLKSLGLRSAFLLPLTARGQILGAISFTMGESGRRFDPVDRPSIEELVRRASMAVDNARLYAQAQAAIRARDEFLAMASHDLRSPLASLRLQTHLLQEKRLDGDRTTETTLIKGIDRASARIIAMLDNLLDAGRISLELEDIDLADLARDALERQQELLERAGCSWSVNAPQPVVGHWDRLRLEQVLMNLVSNAAKYGAGHAVEVSVQSAPGAGILRVRDGGIGISAEDCAKLFQPFERVGNKAASRGTGLGLWIVRTIVEAMGGSVRVFSEPGHGATFEVALPTRPPEGVTEAAKPKQA